MAGQAPGGAPIPERERSSSGPRLALLLVVLLGLGLRWAGLDHLLPHKTEQDDQITRQVAAWVEEGGWEPGDPRGMEDYPTLISRVALLFPFAERPGSAESPAELGAHLASAGRYHLRVRALSALASAALVAMTYLLARRFVGPWTSVLAASFVALDPLHLLFAPQARGHAIVAATLLLAVLAALRLRERPSLSRYLVLGLAGGLSVGSLQSGLAALPVLLVAHLAREKEPRASWLGPLLALALVALSFVFFYKEILIAAAGSGMIDAEGGGLNQSGHHITRGMFAGGGFLRVPEFVLTTNPVLAVLAAAGALLLLARLLTGRARLRWRSDAMVVLGFVVPFALVLGIFNRTMERFTLPLHPYLGLLAASFLAWSCVLLARMLPRPPRPALLAAGAALVLAFPAWCCARLAWLRVTPDTVALVTRELLARARPEDLVLLVAPAELPCFYDPRSLASDGRPGPWLDYQRAVPPEHRSGKALRLEKLTTRRPEGWLNSPDSIERLLRESRARFLVISVGSSSMRQLDWLQSSAQRWGQIVARFPSGRHLDPQPILYYGWSERFLAELLDMRSLGMEMWLLESRASLAGDRP